MVVDSLMPLGQHVAETISTLGDTVRFATGMAIVTAVFVSAGALVMLEDLLTAVPGNRDGRVVGGAHVPTLLA
jgi:hypothetical protein